LLDSTIFNPSYHQTVEILLAVFYFIYQDIFVHIVSFVAFYFLNANNVCSFKKVCASEG